VTNILDYFVPWWEAIATIKYKNMEQDIVARNNTKKLLDKNMIVLINKGSASASEIFAGVVKDYVKNTILLWTKTFGKGSVQSLVEYTDGSMLKYTVAKRFTGWSKKNINLEWISPDLKLEDDPKTARDEILEVAKVYKFR
jgi:carboxyl-terminal processing protease